MSKCYYKFNNLQIEQFAIFEDKFLGFDTEIMFQTGVQFSFSKTDNLFCCKIIVIASQLDNIIVKADLNNLFDISKESINSLTKDGLIEFPVPLLVQFASLGYGTMRGIIYTKTLNSKISPLITPPIFIDSFINKNFIVKE